MLQSVKVKDYMAANLVTFTPDMDIMDAVSELIRKRISGASVLDEHGNIVGILSERDCLQVTLHSAYYSEGGAGRVAEYMQADVTTIDADMSILELAELFLSNPLRRYPVVQHNRLVGQISIRDVLRALAVIAAPESHAR